VNRKLLLCLFATGFMLTTGGAQSEPTKAKKCMTCPSGSEPKPGSPEYYWIDYTKECFDNCEGDAECERLVMGLLGPGQGQELVKLSTLCASARPTVSAITLADMQSGAYVTKYKQLARAVTWVKNCQCKP
jgi:hypothetical protein